MKKRYKKIPRFTANCMCKGAFQKGSRRCLSRWVSWFGSNHGYQLSNLIHDNLTKMTDGGLIISYNDTHTCAQNAALLNKAVKQAKKQLKSFGKMP